MFRKENIVPRPEGLVSSGTRKFQLSGPSFQWETQRSLVSHWNCGTSGWKPLFPLERWTLALGFSCPNCAPIMDFIYLTLTVSPIWKAIPIKIFISFFRSYCDKFHFVVLLINNLLTLCFRGSDQWSCKVSHEISSRYKHYNQI